MTRNYRDIYERRQSELASAELDRERKVLENLEIRIDIVERLVKMHKQIESEKANFGRTIKSIP